VYEILTARAEIVSDEIVINRDKMYRTRRTNSDNDGMLRSVLCLQSHSVKSV